MLKKKNVLIGVIGFIIDIVILILIMKGEFFSREVNSIILLIGLSLLLFFVGFAVGGFRFGIPIGLHMAALLGIIAAPSQIGGPLALLFFGALFIGPKILDILRKRKINNGEIDEFEEQQKLEAEIEAVFNNSVYLIKTNKFKADVTYKVVDKGDHIYFCRCGGQFHDLDPEIAKNAQLTESELLAHKNSFSLKKDDINAVEINSKIRLWTGNIPNNGSVNIITESKTDFIIHEINDYPQIQAFLENALNCPVTVVIDQKRKQIEDADAELEMQDSKTKYGIKKTANLLNILGTASGLWLIFYPRPIKLVVAVCVIIPIVSLAFYVLNSRLVSFDEKNTHKPATNVLTAIMVPSFALSLVSMIAFDVRYVPKVWVTIIVITIIVSAFLLIKTKEYKRHKSLIIVIPMFIFVYIYGFMITTNCVFGYHSPVQYYAEAVDKEYNDSSESNKYSVVIEDWHDEENTIKVSVSEKEYNSINIGQNVYVYSLKGLWGIEWFLLRG